MASFARIAPFGHAIFVSDLATLQKAFREYDCFQRDELKANPARRRKILVEERRGHRPEAMRGHLLRGVAKTARILIHRIFRHRLARSAEGWEEISPPMVVLMQFFQHRNHLTGQRYPVRAAHLHPFGRNEPDGLIEVYVGPFRLPQFPGAEEDMR